MAIGSGIIRFLGGRPGEEGRIFLLLSMGFFMGIFLATLQVPAETLITALGEEYFDRAFLLGGGLGILSASAYVFAQRHMPFATLVVLNLTFTIIVLIGIRFAFEWYDYKQASFWLFVLMGPVTSVILLTFWGIFGRIFDIRTSKRVIGGIDTGQLSATCMAFFAISFASRFIHTIDFLWITIISGFAVLLIALRIVWRYDLSQMGQTTKEATTASKKDRKISYLDLFKNRYFFFLSVFLFFSVFASKFNEFTYRTSMFTWYEGDEATLNQIYSIIDAIIIVVSFLIQTFVNDYIIGKYGLKVSLMVMPILLGLFTIGAIVSGHLFGYEIRSNEYFIFFSFNVMGRIMTTSLRDALENPAYKMFFFPISVNQRFDVQSRIEGVVNEMATLLSGAALIGLGLLKYVGLIEISYLLILLVVMIIFMAGKLFEEYKKNLKVSLLRQKYALQDKGKRNEHNMVQVLSHEFSLGSSDSVIMALKLSERLEPMMFRRLLVTALENSSEKVRRYAYQKCVEVSNIEHLEKIKALAMQEQKASLRKASSAVVDTLSSHLADNVSPSEWRQLLRSPDVRDRRRLAQLLRKHPNNGKVTLYLLELLKDINPRVRAPAIITAGLLKSPEYYPALIANLHVPAYANTALSALVACGDKATQPLDLSFYRTGQHLKTMLRVVQVLGRIGGPPNLERIWKKIDYPNKRIFFECVTSLSYHSIRASRLRLARLKIQIEQDISDTAWNISVLLRVGHKHPLDRMLRTAIEEENKQNQDDIFMVMAMIYDPQSVRLVKENIELNTAESSAYAIELMNIFLDDDLKGKIFPLFDDMRHEERLKQFSNYFPPEYFRSYEDVLNQIVHRDYNQINRWTKALALYRLALLDSVKVTPDIIANVFNPDKLLLQPTAYALYKKDKNAYRHHTLRIESKKAKELDMLFLRPSHLPEGAAWRRPMLEIEKGILLKQIPAFADVPGEVLVELAELSQERNLKAGTTFVKQGDTGRVPIFVVVQGQVRVHSSEETLAQLGKNSLIGLEMLLPSDTFTHNVTTETDTTVLVIEIDDLFDLMGLRLDLVEAMLRYVRHRHTLKTASVGAPQAEVLMS